MIAPQRVISRLAPLSAILALGAVGVAARADPHTAGSRVSISLPSGQGSSSSQSCPLSLAQQLKAVKTFSEMMPVFRHPRCTNCHGGVNPFVEEEVGKHRGGAMEVNNAKECQTCHDGLPGWDTPGEPMFFQGKSDETICMQIREFSPNGHDFVEHIRHDHGNIQFIAAGFKGDRALGEGLKDYDLVVEKPPGTQGELTEKARKWVQAMGGEFQGGHECGCVKPTIELKMTSEWTGEGAGSIIRESVSVTVPLKPDTSGVVFKGKAPLEHGRYSVTTPPGCRVDMKPSGGALEVTEARFDVGAEERMTISLAVTPSMSGGTMTFICPKLPVPLPIMPILPWVGEWQYVHRGDLIGTEYHFDDFESASGLSLGGERKLVGRKEVTRQTTIEEVVSTAKTTFEFWWVGPQVPQSPGQ